MNELTDNQLKNLITGLLVGTIEEQKSDEYLKGDLLSLKLAHLVATSDKKILALDTLFSAAHYSPRRKDLSKLLAKNHLIGKPYQDDYDYLIIPVIRYGKSKVAPKEMETSIGHWLCAIYFRQKNKLLYIDPYGGENFESIPNHVKLIINRGINTVGPVITTFKPEYFTCNHNRQMPGNTIDCGYFWLFYVCRFFKYDQDPAKIFDSNFNLSNFKIELFKFYGTVIAAFKGRSNRTKESVTEEVNKSFSHEFIQQKSPQKKGEGKKKLPPKVKPTKTVLISSKQGRPPKVYYTNTSDIKSKKSEKVSNVNEKSENNDDPRLDEVVNDSVKIPLKLYDLNKVKENEWINDQVIDSVIFKDLINGHDDRILVSALCFGKTMPGYWGPEKKPNQLPTIPSYNPYFTKAIIPVNFNNRHWSLGILDKPTKTCTFYCTLRYNIFDKKYASQLKKLKLICRLLLDEEANIVVAPTNSFLRQLDDYNCGPFIAMLAKRILENKSLFFGEAEAIAWREYVYDYYINFVPVDTNESTDPDEIEVIEETEKKEEVSYESDSEETPFKISKISETPATIFNSLSLNTPENEKRFFNNSLTPKNSQVRIRRKKCAIVKGDTVVDGSKTDTPMEIDFESNQESPMEIDRQILTPKRRFALNKKIKTEPISPTISLNDSVISDNVGATPLTTDNEADNEESFIELCENEKLSGLKACVLPDANVVVVKNRYTSDPRQLMTVETDGKRTILHKTNITPTKKSAEAEFRFKVDNSDKTKVKVNLQKIISPKKTETVKTFVLNKTAVKEKAELNTSDASIQKSPKKKINNKKIKKGRLMKKQRASATEESESEVKSDSKNSKKDLKNSESTEKCESKKDEAIEIDTTETENIVESDSSVANSDAPLIKRRGRPKKAKNKKKTPAIKPPKAQKEGRRPPVNNSEKTEVNVKLQKIISPKKTETVKTFVLKKTTVKEKAELNTSDSSLQSSSKKRGFFTNKPQKPIKGRFMKKMPSATEESEFEVQIDSKNSKKNYKSSKKKIVEESTQIVMFDTLSKSQQAMPPPNLFKAYNKAMGKDFEKVEISKSPEKCESKKDEVIEIDTTETENIGESDSSVVNSDAPLKKTRGRPKTVKNESITVTESEIEKKTSTIKSPKAQKKGGRPPKKTYVADPAKPKRGRPGKAEELPSKFPKPIPVTARCWYGHEGGCAAYSVNHKMEYKNHGNFDKWCEQCGAYLNEYEAKTPSLANKCCNNGDLCTKEILEIEKILQEAPQLMKDLIDNDKPDSKKFKAKSHIYNKLVAFGTIQTKSKLPPLPGGPGGGPNVVRLNGDLTHHASDFFPPEGKKPQLGQMYCIDLQDAEDIMGEKAKEFKVSEDIAKKLLKMVNDNHEFAKLFKTASEKLAEQIEKAKNEKKDLPQFRCIIVDSRDPTFKTSDPTIQTIHAHSAEKPRNELIGMIWSNDTGEPPEFNGIWLNGRNGQTHFVPYWSPNVDPLCYPLLFPKGTQIYHNGMELKKVENEKKKAKKIMEEDVDVSDDDIEHHVNKSDDEEVVDENILEDDPSKKRTVKGRRFASRKQVTRFFLYPRNKRGFKEAHWLWSKGPIADAWLIDMVCRAERAQLDEARKRVEKMKKRCTTSNDLKKYVEKNYLNNKKLGSMFTIPRNFKGGRKYMQNAYSDIMTIIENTKLPSYFVTFTGNPKWKEITDNTNPGETRSDLKCRVFLTKAQEFLDDLFKGNFFGKVQAFHVILEHQKRGMPHLHVLLIMEDEVTVADVDNYISARIPELPAADDKSEGAEQQRRYHALVLKHMLHICNTNSACQVNGRCTKGFKKNFSPCTIIHSHKPPDYERLKPESAADKNSSATKNENENLHGKDKVESVDEKMEHDWNDDSIFNVIESKAKDETENLEEKDKNDLINDEVKTDANKADEDDEWEDDLPFFDELRKDFVEELSNVQYKRLPPPEGVEVTEETQCLYGFTARKTIKGKTDLVVDDSVVVPHNKILLLKYDCHINVECTIGQTGSPKYTCKYVTKQGEVVCAKLQKVKINENGEEVVDYDEGERHLVARIMTGCEAFMRASNCWIIKQSHIVECLQVHLEGGNTKVFEPGYEAQAAEKDDKSQLLAFFNLCKKNKNAQKFTYRDIPQHYRYTNGAWVKRKNNPQKFFVRIKHVSPKNSELFALRMLLMKVKGPQSFEHLRTVKGTIYPTFLQTAQALGLWESDELHMKAITEAFNEMRSIKQKRFFFAMVIAFNNPANPDEFLKKFLDDIFDRPGQDRDKTRPERYQKGLRYLEFVFRKMGTNCRTLGFDVPKDFEENCESADFDNDYNEADGDYKINDKVVSQKDYAEYKRGQLNPEQGKAFDEIWDAIINKKGGFFSLIGSGGVGKTFFYNTLIFYCKAHGVNPMVCASTGIAATLLTGGQTAHSAFCIPKSMDSETPVRIQGETKRGEQLQNTELIIIDECSMLHKNIIEYINKTMQDMKDNKQLFGGSVVLIGGDWKQLTPVVPKGNPEAVIDASIKKWDEYDQSYWQW
uniref:ATP-dependent DNA helicase n=1 Tax=Panagrolaimus davidi TaxID=227884 RepID=A0A914PGD5_9BILA